MGNRIELVARSRKYYIALQKSYRQRVAPAVPNWMNMPAWTPKGEGAAFTLSPILQPLSPFRERLLVLSGLDLEEADALPGEGAGDHQSEDEIELAAPPRREHAVELPHPAPETGLILP